MTKRYTGGVVSSSLPTVNAAGASGVFNLSQQSDYQAKNNWPPYKIEESLRFRASASGYLNRTPSVSGNRRTWTLSGWIKRGALGTFAGIFGVGVTSNSGYASVFNCIRFTDANVLSAFEYDINTATTFYRLDTTQVFRDPAAWYHIVFAFDSTQATASNRWKLYVNGTQVTAFSTATYPSQNYDTLINTAAKQHDLGLVTNVYYDGYMSEINFVDGQQLTPTSFGATDKDGNWSPISYTGTYGQNGFYLNFSNNTSAVTMGSDFSGNGNNWTLNGFNVSTANTTYDIMIDVPEDQAGANNRGNYATLNPISNLGNGTISAANLNFVSTTDAWRSAAGTMFVNSGKFYFEGTLTAFSGSNPSFMLGVCNTSFSSFGSYAGSSANAWVVQGDLSNTKKWNNDVSSTISAGQTSAINDVFMVAVDVDASKIWFGRNGTWYSSGDPVAGTNAAYTTLSGQIGAVVSSIDTLSTIALNFGQRPFTYAPPTGFKSLNTFNLPDPAIKQPNKYFDALLWTGDGTNGRNITGYGFSPEFLWIKKRSGSEDHKLNDIVRGVDKQLMSNRTEPEYTNTDQVKAFLANGFTTDSSGSTNGSGATYVGWAWNAGGSTVTNTSGTISSQVRANPTAGFSIVTYTGTGSNATVGHGLGAAPSWVIVKGRNVGSTNWFLYTIQQGATKYLDFSTGTGGTDSTSWNNTAPTSSVFSVGSSYYTNYSATTYVAYCFAPIAGYSSFGSYTGNGSTDGPFIHTGFRPRFFMTKCTSSTSDWHMTDTARYPTNSSTSMGYLDANLSAAEGNFNIYDGLSNGFKVRDNGSQVNGSGATYIYMAFAEAPFKYSRSR